MVHAIVRSRLPKQRGDLAEPGRAPSSSEGGRWRPGGRILADVASLDDDPEVGEAAMRSRYGQGVPLRPLTTGDAVSRADPGRGDGVED